ncbi:MAG: glycerol-3-phosphate dehydrogenase/oxidase [Desulfobacula sp.]|uniref:glycerol-3-phosphate dehydrogenase/oxidase n=1 Tax=Desulfobacula sp. TaxID=2593537 RepID=UPI0025BE927F|nr:glycerol-3-phosphate dehydrogenase/oxidase [Desulfobacula sp.]MCD4720457.1 glycerol-3-phosphate dehydrogenase/oxidase [Desulfobacula sp.]
MKFSDINKEYDVIVAGGGITGAGIFYESVKKGYRVLLLEAKDFAWGTSSRSSKMVHGGLRYLKQGKFLLTKAAVKERERLLKQYPGLVTPLKFIMPVFDHYGPSRSSMKIGLSIYSFMAGEKQHNNYTKAALIEKISGIREKNLVSGVGFKDAQVDDARLVLRLIYEGCLLGGTALNYTRVTGIERDQKGYLAAVNAMDIDSLASVEIKTKVLINATGAFAETLHPSPMKGFHIRPLRGSHLIFPKSIFPLDRVISFIHPQDLRPVFLFPWEESVLLGTTDVDHDQDMKMEPFVTMKEADYLMEGLNHILPDFKLSLNDCISSIAGVRPVLSKKKKAASRESREHVVWKDKGLVTATGGKLTTFQMLANDALKAAKPYLPKPAIPNPEQKIKDQPWDETCRNVSDSAQERLLGRYGSFGWQMIRQYDEELFNPIENTKSLWAEIRYAAEYENIRHLSDLLLRRVRVGLLLPEGGKNLLDRIETLCKPYLSQNNKKWDNKKWDKEKKAYIKLWETYYSPPNLKVLPNLKVRPKKREI